MWHSLSVCVNFLRNYTDMDFLSSVLIWGCRNVFLLIISATYFTVLLWNMSSKASHQFALLCAPFIVGTAIMHNLLTISARIWFNSIVLLKPMYLQLSWCPRCDVLLPSALLEYSWGSQVIQGLYHLALAVHLCLELCLLFLLCYHSYLGPVPSQAVFLTSWTPLPPCLDVCSFINFFNR